ncbi:MAG: alanyl-tRNA editing protein, partial [Firmicutes bacterium]|nr:alanyl-tRNA editing protein [Bacillota bacterium]
YQKDVYLKEAELVVSEIREYKGKQQVACESTIFFPEGGGQLCDLGMLDGVAVTDVKEDKETGTVWHTVADASGFEPGKTVKAVLDWQRRFDHMQMHCGEHILSGRFHELFGVENHGFHMGEDYMTIDMLAKDGSPITDEMIAKAELAANEVIWRNVPVVTTWFDTAEEALSMPVRKEIKFGEDISVVTVGSVDAPLDCCACCGTHPSTTGQVGLVTVLKAENYKGMTRMTIKAGRPAFEEARTRSKIASQLAQKYSTEVSTLLDREAANDAKNDEVRRELSELKSALSKQEEEKLREALPKAEGSLAVFRYPLMSADDLQSMARKAEDIFTKPSALFSEKDKTVVLATPGTPAAGQLVKDYAGMYGGKGGGSRNLARAIFSKKADAELFMDLIEKHLR